MECNVSVSKKMTVNTGGYSSVSPSLTLTIKDVDLKKLPEVYKKLEIIADGLYHHQLKGDCMTMTAIKELGIKKYFRNIDMDGIDKEIEINLKSLLENE